MLQEVEDLEIGVETDIPTTEIGKEPLYCICQQPWDKYNRKFMIQCDNCKSWFHGSCIGLEEQESHEIEKYHCSTCEQSVGPSMKREVGKKPIKAGTRVFIDKLREKTFSNPGEIIIRMQGHSLTLPHLINKGFNLPIVVENKDGLGLTVPSDDFTVLDVEKYVGSDHPLDVIDVEKQTDVKMTMTEFAEYFSSPERTKLYNLISLEFSKTSLNDIIIAPEIARKLDWVATSWPNDVDENLVERPTVSKYCLISTKNSYTDFHIDFGGTSVWYHVLWGEKTFYLIEPTPGNLSLYARWMSSIDQYESFFADSVDHCYRCVLRKGETLFIPTGWIHAVLTVEDSLVFGGNFLHSLNMDLQLQVYDIEKKLNVPLKYLYPGFEATHWYAARSFVTDLECLNKIEHVPPHILRGSKALLAALKSWHSDKIVTGTEPVTRIRRECIPPKVKPNRLLKDLTEQVRKAERLARAAKTKPSHRPLELIKSNTSPQNEPSSDDIEQKSFVSSSGVEAKEVTTESPETQQKVSIPLKLKLKVPTLSVKDTKSSSSANKSPTVAERGAGGLKLKLSSISSKKPKINFLPNLRLSLTDGEPKVKIVAPTNTGSDNESDQYDSDNGLKIDTDDEAIVPVATKARQHRKKQHGKKHSRNKANLDLEKELEGTVDGINELIKTSDYEQRITAFSQGRSELVKDSFHDMLSMGQKLEGTNKRGKSKRKMVMNSNPIDPLEYVSDKVHQDDDFIYLPLAGSDDEGSSPSKRKKHTKDNDSNWSPGVKVGKLQKRDHQPTRAGAKRKHVEKGLEKAAAQLKLKEEKRVLHKHRRLKSSSPEKLLGLNQKLPKLKLKSPTRDPSSSKVSAHSSQNRDSSSKSSQPRKPKKGMATPKQRLGKILGLNKLTKF